MHSLASVVPLLILAGILALILVPFLRRRLPRPQPRTVRKAAAPKLTLHVTPSQMDDELKDLIRRS
jgi:hypothetical protein